MSAQRRLILIAAAIAVAMPAPAAHAKGIAGATVCGADDCSDVARLAQGPRDCAGCTAEQLLTALPGSARPSRRAPWVRIVLEFGEPGGEVQGRERVLWAPSLQLSARSDGRSGWAWFQPTGEALAVAHRIARGIRPFPAASMPFEDGALTAAQDAAQAAAPDAAPAPGPAAQRPDEAGGIALLPGGAILAAGLGAGALALRRRRRRA